MTTKDPQLPTSIEEREFSTSRRGYDKREVRAFLSELESNFRELVQEGREREVFHTSSDRWSSYAILDMGIGVSAWYNPAGSVAPDELAATYAEFALRMLGAD